MASEEPHVVEALVDLCKSLNIRCVVQVGAEDGYEAWEIKRAIEASGAPCRAVGIDADPQTGPYRDVEWHEALIGATDAPEAPFYLYAKGLSSQVPRGEDEKRVTLPMQRLDTFCWGIAATPDALIIDTEGTTLDVLRGATGILGQVRLIYAECSDGELRPGYRADIEQVEALLKPLGFAQRTGLPAYDAGGQGNYAWVKP